MLRLNANSKVLNIVPLSPPLVTAPEPSPETRRTAEDIKVDSLRDDQVADLNRPKGWLYRKRTDIRFDRDQAERPQLKEKAGRAEKGRAAGTIPVLAVD